MINGVKALFFVQLKYFFTICFLLVWASNGLAHSDDYRQVYQLFREGSTLSDKEAASLEEELNKDSKNLPLRIKLLGYYSLKQFEKMD